MQVARAQRREWRIPVLVAAILLFLTCVVAAAQPAAAEPGPIKVVSAAGTSDQVCTTAFGGSPTYCTSYSLQLSQFHFGDLYLDIGSAPQGRGLIGGYKYVAVSNSCLFDLAWGFYVVSTAPKAITHTCIQLIGNWWSYGELPILAGYNYGILDSKTFYMEEGTDGANGYVGWQDRTHGELVKYPANSPVVINLVTP